MPSKPCRINKSLPKHASISAGGATRLADVPTTLLAVVAAWPRQRKDAYLKRVSNHPCR
jgi:hypothetical protein